MKNSDDKLDIRETAKVRKISVPSLTLIHTNIVTQRAAHNMTAILFSQTIYLDSIMMTLLLGHNDQIFSLPPCNSQIICSQLNYLLKDTLKL